MITLHIIAFHWILPATIGYLPATLTDIAISPCSIYCSCDAIDPQKDTSWTYHSRLGRILWLHSKFLYRVAGTLTRSYCLHSMIELIPEHVFANFIKQSNPHGDLPNLLSYFPLDLHDRLHCRSFLFILRSASFYNHPRDRSHSFQLLCTISFRSHHLDEIGFVLDKYSLFDFKVIKNPQLWGSQTPPS